MFSGNGDTGRWALNEERVHLVGGGPLGAVDGNSEITQADAISFTVFNDGDGSSTSWRRCARSEVEAPAPAQASDASTLGGALSADEQR